MPDIGTQVITRSEIRCLESDLRKVESNLSTLLSDLAKNKAALVNAINLKDASLTKRLQERVKGTQALVDICNLEIEEKSKILNNFKITSSNPLPPLRQPRKEVSIIEDPLIVDPIPGPSASSSPILLPEIVNFPIEEQELSLLLNNSLSSINFSDLELEMDEVQQVIGDLNENDQRMVRVFTSVNAGTMNRVLDKVTEAVSHQKKEAIPFFSGTKGEVTFRSWFDDAVKRADSEGWTDVQRKQIFSDRLKGAAKIFNATLANNLNFDAWADNFKNRFRDEAEVEILKANLTNLSQSSNMRVRDFAESIDLLYTKIYGPLP